MTLRVLDIRVPQIGSVHERTALVIYWANVLILGAALCLINTYCSIAFIFPVQLNDAIAPRFRRPARA